METHTDVALLRDPVIVGFAAWLAEESGFARRTHRTYTERVATYLAWLTESGEHSDALDDRGGRDRAVGAYLADARDRELAPATINVTLAALSALYTWLGLGEPTAARASDPQVPLRVLDPAEQRALLTAAAAEGPRAMALVTLGLDVGPRESELVALDIDALDLTEHPGSIEITDSAGAVRTVPLQPGTRAAQVAWLAHRRQLLGRHRAASERALFISLRAPHGRVALRTVDDIVREVGTAAGLVVSPSTLRATAERREWTSGTEPATIAARFGQRATNRDRVHALLGGAPRRARGSLTDSEQLLLFGDAV
ncbi:tyrosine-type recombinase/integrase [Nocardia salmonicida]|uniref:tyrosine-type recombinase/integrase n=1 Tax=Nocardia salmonicida TaxID=53431 RepID=UPI003788FB81